MEIQELMKQIDVSVNAQKIEWQNKLKIVNDRLTLKEQELILMQTTNEQKNAEIAKLQKNVENLERSHQRLTTYYHDQLMTFKDEIAAMKNEHARLLKKYDIRSDLSHSKREAQRLVTTVEICNSQISQLEKERKILENRFEIFGDEDLTKSGTRNHYTGFEGRIKKVSRQRDQQRKDIPDLSSSSERVSSMDDGLKLRSHIEELLKVIHQKDYYIKLMESNQNENALIGCLESDLYSAKQDMKNRIEREDALKDKIKHLEKCLSQSNNQCKKLVDQIISLKESEDFTNCKKDLADKEAQILQLKKEAEKMEEIKSQLEQNESNIKIELQVLTAQLNALKLENSNLRRIYISDMSSNNSDSMKYFQELQQAYYESLRTLEDKNRNLEMAMVPRNCSEKKCKRSSIKSSVASPVHSEISKQSHRHKLHCGHSSNKKMSMENGHDYHILEKYQRKSQNSKRSAQGVSSANNNNNFVSSTTSYPSSGCLTHLERHYADRDEHSSDANELSLSSRSSISETQVSLKVGSIQEIP